MKIKRLGYIYQPKFDGSWQDNSAFPPVPLILEDRIRVFCGMRDVEGVGRIGYIDLEKNNILNVIDYSKKPALDIGDGGCFDDNGVVPCCLLREGEKILLYYTGFLIPKKYKCHGFSGLAESDDNGVIFTRVSKVPIMERTNNATTFRAIQAILKEGDLYRVYYVGGSKIANNRPMYELRYCETNSPYSFPKEYKVTIPLTNNRTRIGKPNIFKKNGTYFMLYSFTDSQNQYSLEGATSQDGINWKPFNIDVYGGDDTLDNIMSAYHSVIEVSGKYYVLYNGNDYGRFGLLVGELEF